MFEKIKKMRMNAVVMTELGKMNVPFNEVEKAVSNFYSAVSLMGPDWMFEQAIRSEKSSYDLIVELSENYLYELLYENPPNLVAASHIVKKYSEYLGRENEISLKTKEKITWYLNEYSKRSDFRTRS